MLFRQGQARGDDEPGPVQQRDDPIRRERAGHEGHRTAAEIVVLKTPDVDDTCLQPVKRAAATRRGSSRLNS
ncbi:hypothetical protein JIX56_25325 [Streptomyces sp. CA-210063]|uniref:hypothetical protein n=1 Tax=Streptomyces sp. CA-210063 TaxID=2801029 RepID=UPI00214BC1C3|nr:hypothetical protein [Streptomyces sp. CA-210063]UUU32930.1 hypothetical protein JIX56_25325 [Streptomyces sp. CA-210063]